MLIGIAQFSSGENANAITIHSASIQSHLHISAHSESPKHHYRPYRARQAFSFCVNYSGFGWKRGKKMCHISILLLKANKKKSHFKGGGVRGLAMMFGLLYYGVVKDVENSCLIKAKNLLKWLWQEMQKLDRQDRIQRWILWRSWTLSKIWGNEVFFFLFNSRRRTK